MMQVCPAHRADTAATDSAVTTSEKEEAQMSAHLTVYAMAIDMERPVRMREADHASRIALADASAEPRSGRLLRRLGTAIRQFRRPELTAEHWAGIGTRACTVMGQPAH